MKRKEILLAVLAFVLVLSSAAGNAWAYFTTYAEAQGGHPIKLNPDTDIEEGFSNWTKTVSIVSADDSEPVYVRVKAFSGSEYGLVYSTDSDKWVPGADDYYYYSDILYAGERTDALKIEIKDVPDSKKAEIGDSLNVVVIYERTPVQYNEDGSPYADWNIKLENDTSESDGAQKEGE